MVSLLSVTASMPPQFQKGISSGLAGGSQSRQQQQQQQPPPRIASRPPRQYGVTLHNIHNKNIKQGDLRVAYKAQTGTGNNNGNNNNNHNNNMMFDDQHSTSSVSAANSGAAPSSVYMPSSIALSRDSMSDLSGVSGGTHRGSSSHNIPGQIFDPKSLMKPWKQAYELSNFPPEQILWSSSGHGHGHGNGNDDEENGGINNDNNRNATNSDYLPSSGESGNGNISNDANANVNAGSASIWVAQNDVVEIFEFDNLQSSLGLDRFQIMGGQHTRIPVMILLIDPTKQSYELMQIWVDRAIDNIRDLVHVLQHKIPDKWKQAYDGLFQIRGNRFTQLINIIRLVKYDVQPHEILVAKPWAMTAKVTIAFAGSAIRHLTRIGVISKDSNDTSDDKEQYRPRPPKNEDAPLLLSQRAQDRAYFPEGILNHHHAIQFITFSPPFESANNATGISIPPSNRSSSQSINSLHSSIGPNSLNSRMNPSLQRKTSQSFSKVANSMNHNRSITEGSSNEIKTAAINQQQKQKKQRRRRSGGGGRGGFFSKLNCCRSSTTTGPGVQAVMRKSDSVSMDNSALRKSPLTSLSEEEEKHWLAYSMKPIAEEQSVASCSVVSMSAPLLSQTTSHLARRHTVHPQATNSNNFRTTNSSQRYSRSRIIDNEYEL
jgi:hypothetical protein